jgi:polar amino acid transport system substrate-binding protein
MRRLVPLVAAIVALAQHAAAEPLRLRVASEGARPPFNYLDANNQLAGFEIDLTRELCRRMSADCAFITQDWESLIPGLAAGQYDVIVAAMEITKERQQKIAFSKPYARTPSALIAPRQSTLASVDPAALAGLRIGVEADSPQQSYLEDKYPKSEIARYATLEEAMLDLAEDRVDAVVHDKLAALEFLKSRKEGRCCHIAADLPQDPAYFGAGIGYGLRKTDAALRASLDSALDATIADGTFDTIRVKYFDFDIR